MRRFLLFVFFVLSVLPAAAQEPDYIITESELTRLEKISENLETLNQNQRLQIQNLKTRLIEALNKSKILSKQLQTERETLTSLRQSYAEYEKEVSVEIQEKQGMIDDLKKQGYKLKLALVILSCILGIFSLSGIGFFILKMKLKLRRF